MLNKTEFNIWRYADFYPKIKKENRLTLGEGWTSEVEIKEITNKLSLGGLFFKKEYENPTGSQKDRGMAYRLSKALEDNDKELVIPSCGNAALSAAAYCDLAGIKLYACVLPSIEKAKLEKIKSYGAEVSISKNVVSSAEKMENELGIKNLRPSSDIIAHIGFRSISLEIHEKLGEVDSIFVPVSSACTFLGIGEAFSELEKMGLSKMPQLHAVQTCAVAPIAGEFQSYKKEKTSIAKGIMANQTILKDKAINFIKKSKGSGWIVSDKEILNALELLDKYNIQTSPEGGAALAGLIKASEKLNLGRVVCLLTGRRYLL